jgi:hypothetical protein
MQTTGAKLFSSHACAPTDKPLLDTDPNLYSVQKTQSERAPFDIMKSVSVHAHQAQVHNLTASR